MKKINSNLYDLHESSILWLSELEFMRDEQVFLEHLLSTHFLDLSSSKLYDSTRKLIKKLKEVEHLGTELIENVESHSVKLGTVMESVSESTVKDIFKEHKALKKDFENYVLKFRYVKKKIFGIVKEIMVHHKQKLLINKV